MFGLSEPLKCNFLLLRSLFVIFKIVKLPGNKQERDHTGKKRKENGGGKGDWVIVKRHVTRRPGCKLIWNAFRYFRIVKFLV